MKNEEDRSRRKNPERNKKGASRRNRNYVSLDLILARVGVPRQLDSLALEVLREAGLHERLYVRRGDDAREVERFLLDLIEALHEGEVIQRRPDVVAARRNPDESEDSESEADSDDEADQDYDEGDDDDWGAAA